MILPQTLAVQIKKVTQIQKHQGIDELLTQIFSSMTKQPKLQQESFGSFQLPWKGNIHLPLN